MSHIEKIAIVGASGRIGSAIARHLLYSNTPHTITGLTRKSSNTVLPEGVTRVEVDYTSPESLISALTGHQFLIITLHINTPHEVHTNLVHAAAKAGVQYVMPNIYGIDIQNPVMMKENLNGPACAKRLADFDDDVVKKSGMAYVVLVCGYWYEFGLALGELFFGFDVKARKVTFYDEGRTKVDLSSWEQCGRAVAAFLDLPAERKDGEEENEGGKIEGVVADWKNKPLYVHSFKVSQRDVLDSLNRVLGTTDKDWSIDREGSEERFKRGMEMLKNGDRSGFPTASYARMFFQDGGGDYGGKWGLANEVLGVPEENLDEATKRAVKMVEEGWSPY